MDLTSVSYHSLLHLAIMNCNFNMVKTLIEKNADVTRVNGIALQRSLPEFSFISFTQPSMPFAFNLDAICISPLFVAVCCLKENFPRIYIGALEQIIDLLLQHDADLHQICRPSETNCNINEDKLNEHETPLYRALDIQADLSNEPNTLRNQKINTICEHIKEKAFLDEFKKSFHMK